MNSSLDTQPPLGARGAAAPKPVGPKTRPVAPQTGASPPSRTRLKLMTAWTFVLGAMPAAASFLLAIVLLLPTLIAGIPFNPLVVAAAIAGGQFWRLFESALTLGNRGLTLEDLAKVRLLASAGQVSISDPSERLDRIAQA